MAIKHPFTADQIRNMLRRAENDAADMQRMIEVKMEQYARMQRDIGAMRLELEMMEEEAAAEAEGERKNGVGWIRGPV